MAINKVEYGGDTLIDLTADSVTEETLLEGETAHDASGKAITGKAVIPKTASDIVLDPISGMTATNIQNGIEELKADLDNKSDAGHNHDNRYYTESEIDTKLSSKQDSSTAITTSNIGSQSVSYAMTSGKTSELQNNNVHIWEDNEGGNIEIHAGNGHTNTWQADAYDGNFRLYTFRESDGVYNGIGINEDSTITANDFVSSNGATLDTVRKFLPINATQGMGWWIADVLHIDAQNAYGDANRCGYCHSSSVNIPSNFDFGVREVYYYNPNLIWVKLTGWSTSSNVKTWNNMWNGSTWLGWTANILTSGYTDTASWMNIDAITKLRGQGYIIASTVSEGNHVWAVNAWSDSKLKKNIKDTKVNGLDVISKIQHKEYDWKYDDLGDSVKLGYVANELKDVIPEAVISVPQDNFHGYDELYQIDMVKMIPYMTKAIQELSKKVDSLEEEIKQLKLDKIK